MSKEDDNSSKSLTSGLLITRGVVAVLFGIIALAWPQITAVTLAIFVMIWLIISGVTLLIEAFTNLSKGWGIAILKIVLGILQIGVGAYLVQRPGIATLTLISLIALVLVVEGVVNVVSSFIVKEKAGSKVLLAIVGVLYVIAGIAIWRYPVSGGLAFLWVLGFSALISGPLYIAAGIELKNSAKE